MPEPTTVRALAERYARGGAAIGLLDRNAEQLAETEVALPPSGCIVRPENCCGRRKSPPDRCTQANEAHPSI